MAKSNRKQTSEIDNISEATTKKIYPTEPDTEGRFYETEDDETMDVHTVVYPNGSRVKKLILSDGRKAIIRELKGRDMLNIKRWIQNDSSIDFDTAVAAQATKINDEVFPPDYYLDLSMANYSRVLSTCQALNFQ